MVLLGIGAEAILIGIYRAVTATANPNATFRPPNLARSSALHTASFGRLASKRDKSDSSQPIAAVCKQPDTNDGQQCFVTDWQRVASKHCVEAISTIGRYRRSCSSAIGGLGTRRIRRKHPPSFGSITG
jgi:hypothetical protein